MPLKQKVQKGATSENLGQTVREFSDSIDLESDGLAAADEVGDFNSESKEEDRWDRGRAETKRTAPCRRSGQGPGEGPGLHSKSAGRDSENVLDWCRSTE